MKYEAFSGYPEATSLKNFITNADLVVVTPLILSRALKTTCGSSTSYEGNLSVP